MCGFLAVIRLNQILAFILRTIVSRQYGYAVPQVVDRNGAVFNKKVKGYAWLRREALGTTYSHGYRLCVEQMG
jgi:hypothetical protein